jgi:hypothetical protein
MTICGRRVEAEVITGFFMNLPLIGMNIDDIEQR